MDMSNFLKPEILRAKVTDYRDTGVACYEKTCYCGNKFYPKSFKAIYCSVQCGAKIRYANKKQKDLPTKEELQSVIDALQILIDDGNEDAIKEMKKFKIKHNI